MTRQRLVFDITVIARWLGQPAGIVRCEQALARCALETRADIRFAIFDKSLPAWREIRREWVAPLIRWDTRLDLSKFQFAARRRGWRRHIPSRFLLTLALEHRRLSARSRVAQRCYAAAQRFLCWPHCLPWPLADRKGWRRGIIPAEAALKELVPGPKDTILAVGNYFYADFEAISALKRRHGFRYVTMCHDLIADSHPEFFKDEVARDFRRHWQAMLPAADRVLVLSRAVERDIRDYCRARGIAPPRMTVTPPGCDIAAAAPAALPAGLVPGRYALFVATIEPRKGHAMILDVWKRLVEKGVPQRHGFKLAIVGKPGWKVTDVLERLAKSAEFHGTLIHLPAADDALLTSLYRDCAFGLLPSIYEGYGMPLVESFAHGRTVIASTGGSLPEVADRFSPCLPPTDSEAWFVTLEQWIGDRNARAPYEAAIRESFRPLAWNEAAARTFAAALDA